MKIYHNPRCSKSRETLEIIREHGIEPEIIEYLKNPPTVKQLKAILNKLKLKPKDILREEEILYRVKYASKNLNDDQLLELLAKYPTLIERPIVIEGRKAVLGRPPSKVLELIPE